MKRHCGLVLTALAALSTLPSLGCNDSSAQGSVSPTTSASAPAPVTQQRVRTHRVERATLDAMQTASGIVRAFHKATVTAETQARVLERVVERGRDVAAGDVIARLDDSRLALELQRAEATLRARRSDLEHAKREFARGERMQASSAISAQQHDDLQHNLDRARDELALARVARDGAERDLRDTRITAPFDGRVDDWRVDVGDLVSPGTPVALMVELSRARVFAGVTGETAARLAPGAAAQVRIAALGGESTAATLRSVATVASERDGTYEVELWIDAPPAGIRDGMVATVQLESSREGAVPLAPRAALLRRAGRPEIFVVEPAPDGSGEVARLRTLRTRRSAGDWIEVVDGLSEGDRVVIDGQFALRDGAPVVRDDAN